MKTAVDLFSGAGGFSTAARAAGLRVLWAGNHWRKAVDIHTANHPEALHLCQDLRQADWRDVPRHDVLLASPSCAGHTHARGKDKPHHDAMRCTAWAVVEALECHRTAVAVVENVPAFTKWVLFPAWEQALTALGYTLARFDLDAANHGVPQNRERVFLVATRSRKPIAFNLPRRDHVPALAILDPIPATTPVAKLCAKSRARIAAGRRQFGDRFLVSYYGASRTGRSLNRPVGTITTRDRWALVEGDRQRMFTVNECRAAMGFPSDYVLPAQKADAKMMLGNAVCPPLATDLLNAIREAV